MLTEGQLSNIKESISTELMKRGIFVDLGDVTFDGRYVRFESTDFQTVPVLFKSIKISPFGSGLSEDRTLENGNVCKDLWISVNARYDHFNGGSNGIDLFNFTCRIFEGEDYITGVKMF